MDDLSEFQELFIKSAKEHLDELADLNTQLSGTDFKKVIESVHLHIHSLRGEAYTMYYNQFGNYLSILETYFKSIIESTVIPDDNFKKILSSEIYEIKLIVEYIEMSKSEPADMEKKIDLLHNKFKI